MKIIENPNLEMIKYPVSFNIQYNLKIIDIMFQEIKNLILTKDLNKNVYLICTGSSGTIISAILTEKLKQVKIKCKIVYIRKINENSHSKKDYNRLNKNFTTIIIDDFIVSGKTINYIYNTINESLDIDILCVSEYIFSNRIAFDVRYLICQKYIK